MRVGVGISLVGVPGLQKTLEVMLGFVVLVISTLTFGCRVQVRVVMPSIEPWGVGVSLTSRALGLVLVDGRGILVFGFLHLLLTKLSNGPAQVDVVRVVLH